MFQEFSSHVIEVGAVRIRARVGGAGPPLLLLHGNPQTHVMWHRVAPTLAEHFTVVATDLTGYGKSSKPPSTADHVHYSKRAMARDQVAVMRKLGHRRFMVAGHDRGARVGYRMALDSPEIDCDHDMADRKAGRRIACPLLVLWGARARLEQWYDTLAVWREWANDVRGRSLDCGHYLPEERPEETARELLAFFAAAPT